MWIEFAKFLRAFAAKLLECNGFRANNIDRLGKLTSFSECKFVNFSFEKIKPMLQWKKIWVHILIWAAMVIYMVTAPAVYAQLFVREGKPVVLNQDLPESTTQIRYSVDRLDPVIINGHSMHRLWGWTFMQGEVDQSVYERFLVLRSDTRTYFYSSKEAQRPDVQSVFADLGLNLKDSGYTTYVAKEPIQIGTYRIGILYRHKSTNETYFVETSKKIIRTPNQLVLTQ